MSTAVDIGHLLRDLAPQVLAALARRCGDFAAAEDAVQEALIAAATQWPGSGVPRSPRGWLHHVAVRRLTDTLRSDIARRRREDAVATMLPATELYVEPQETIADDEALTLIFMCCHPSLSDASAIALTLRAVGGLTTREIAAAFLVPEATMAQRISRAKQSIRAAGARFELPDAAERTVRLHAVLHVLYLIFNEGYASTAGADLQRPDLAREGIRLARALHALLPDEPEVEGLLALMLLTDARRGARTGPAGELIPLDEQDRTRWDRTLIAEGTALLEHALPRGPVGPYRVQAAIAALHDQAPDTDRTDWPQIVELYGVLMRIAGNPMIALNRAIAVAMVHGPVEGLALLDELDRDPRIAGHHRLIAARAHLLARAGDHAHAADCFRRAADRTRSLPERHYLLMRGARAASMVQ